MKKMGFKVLLAGSLLTSLLVGCGQATANKVNGSGDNNISQATFGGKLKVAYLDVGQGDSTLIISPSGQTILIDAGNNQHGDVVVDDIKQMGVKQIDWLIGTHPDADHIGGLDTVIYDMPVKHVVMPKKMHTTKTFEDVLTAIKKKGLKITEGKQGLTLDIGPNAKADVLSPDPTINYPDNNDWSVVTKVTYGNEKFLFTGDASTRAESDMLAAGEDVTANVYKAGHHGSKTSSSTKFLKAVDPEYAVISVGAHNRYHHPNVETLQRLQRAGVKKIYRTDDSGTITVETDGKVLEWKTEK